MPSLRYAMSSAPRTVNGIVAMTDLESSAEAAGSPPPIQSKRTAAAIAARSRSPPAIAPVVPGFISGIQRPVRRAGPAGNPLRA